MKEIRNRNFDEERALYNLRGAIVENCTFAGPADGESALKEASDITVKDCTFKLRYPFWHNRGFSVENCTFTETSRAAAWYSENGKIKDCGIYGIKFLRECADVEFENVTVKSPEFGWRCRGISFVKCDVTSEYFLFESRGCRLSDFALHGKYSFQYNEDLVIENAVLDTKDAFWHAKNVTVRNSKVKGEYLGWYSENLTLENCEISGTQPLCYCKGLKLVNCVMTGTDLAFECSDVEAEINGTVESVKNVRSGRIIADGYGEIINLDAVMPVECEILTRGK